jgi:hypothetical protein
MMFDNVILTSLIEFLFDSIVFVSYCAIGEDVILESVIRKSLECKPLKAMVLDDSCFSF